MIAHPERGERYEILLRAVGEAGFEIREASDHGLDPIAAIHAPDYLAFLREGWGRRAEIDPAAEELLTTQFARTQMHRRPDSLTGLLGYYMADTSTTLRAGTWDAIYNTAQAAIEAADAAHGDGYAYALCRPPGHHAYADSAGGFCYLNNSAIAAERLRTRLGKPVAILDIDVHHGNGTQGIFYARGDVLTVSIHADPSNYFPFYAGYAEEAGVGEGEGRNLNLPLPPGTGDGVFLDTVEQALERISSFAPSALVVALGLDAAEDDPLGVFKITTDGFARVARRIARAGLPTAIIQEGGYLCPALPRNLISFLDAFDRVRS